MRLKRSFACFQVALLFLSRGEMYHEEVWAKWFAGAVGLIPKPTLQVAALAPPPQVSSPDVISHPEKLAKNYLSGRDVVLPPQWEQWE